ncbi:amino acid permease/ SLC12A domain-containing protein [Aspergillus avenaceus]|uniref:Amino acid permease/ SLC12A domain-containing protein n=1 Tax=Aspergillus avenaceus TaxID=36643 RepID=A0A5N6U8B1_ASPAV|nr:amino acid permease/ SLC12A domain-containing protein [Aspergillus avenaceus]
MGQKLEDTQPEIDLQQGQISTDHDLQRRLGNRQVQLLAIGGTIGTALFVTIGNGLAAGGPGSLLVAFSLYCIVLACVNNCISEMTVLHPVPGGFIRLAGHWVDEALGFMVGWIFFFYEALMVPFEITAINLLLTYWRDDIPPAAVCAACIALYAIINVLVVHLFGEAEFWLSGGKVILLLILFLFTFITMVGGNPQHDAYGFRYWKNPGAFAEYRSTGDLGRFEGFLSCLWTAAFTIVGPEYLSIAGAETKRPRAILKTAFKTIYFRFVAFFVLGACCVGIVVPWNDATLQANLAGDSTASGAAGSPYVIAMMNLNIPVLPHLVNALLILTVFSAGNTLTYCATRSVYSLALAGHAPKALRKTTKSGVPIYAYCTAVPFSFLSFLQLSDNASSVLSWLVSLVTAGILIVYVVVCITYLRFYRACQVQGVNRGDFPFVGRFQPYCAYIGLAAVLLVTIFYGYAAFDPWSVEAFFQNYTMQLVAPVLYLGWKLVKRTRILSAKEIDLVWDRPVVDAYEAQFTDPTPGFWTEMGELVGLRRVVRGDQA